MHLTDNETQVDLLKNEVTAKTIIELLREKRDHAVTSAVHSDWGAGKFSMLEMIEHFLSSDKEVLCIIPDVLEEFRILENAEVDKCLAPAIDIASVPRSRHARGGYRDGRDDGIIVGIEVKASATVKTGDFGRLGALTDACGDRFTFGVVPYDKADIVPFDDRLAAALLSSLWDRKAPMNKTAKGALHGTV